MYRDASAQPTAGMHCDPVGLDWVTMLCARWPQCDGIWRPAEDGSAAEPTACSSTSVGVTPRPSTSAWSR